MLRNLRSRRRPRYGPHVCAVTSALLLLLSVSLLHTRLSSSSHSNPHHHPHSTSHQNDDDGFTRQNPLVSDTDSSSITDVDKIDELDIIEDQNDVDNEDSVVDGDQENERGSIKPPKTSGYYVDPITGSIRRALNKRSIEDWDSDYNYNSIPFTLGFDAEDDKSKAAFASDDVPIDEEVREKVSKVDGIEDALLLKIGKRVSPLREGWGDWFDKKGDFLRRDRMFKSNLEVLNPMNNPLLQDPDGVGVTGLTRGDKAVQKLLLNEFKKTPFLVKKPLSVLEMTHVEKAGENEGEIGGRRKSVINLESRNEMKRAERRSLHENGRNVLHRGRIKDVDKNVNNSGNGNVLNKDAESNVIQGDKKSDGDTNSLANGNLPNESSSNIGGGQPRQMVVMEDRELMVQQRKSEELSHVYADGKRWGYFPGLHPHLPFSDFMDSFFRKGKCNMRIFMIWNSPPWMYSVRHQRGLESLLSHHTDACVVMFSETIELDFFKNSFVKDGYKVAVAMPNLDELLQDTPAHIFASIWFQWRKTKYYSTHYSELVRLAALYKYGGIYLDSDIIVLNPLSSLNNAVGMEDPLAGSSLNGAVMAFRKHSPFMMECLKEFYMTYDDTHLRWNGADLLTRVAGKFLGKESKSINQWELKVQPSYIFFPIGSKDITSYFTSPSTENENVRQDIFFNKILNKSLTFHFWNHLTSNLIPEPGSLVTRLIDLTCIRCFDIL